MGSEMWVNIFTIYSLGKDISDLFPADMTLGDVIGFLPIGFLAYYIVCVMYEV